MTQSDLFAPTPEPLPLTDAQEVALCLIVKVLVPAANQTVKRDRRGNAVLWTCYLCGGKVHYTKAEETDGRRFEYVDGDYGVRKAWQEAEARVAVSLQRHLAAHAYGDLAKPVEVLAAYVANHEARRDEMLAQIEGYHLAMRPEDTESLPVAVDWLQEHGWPVPTSAVLSMKRGGGKLAYNSRVAPWRPYVTPEPIVPLDVTEEQRAVFESAFPDHALFQRLNGVALTPRSG